MPIFSLGFPRRPSAGLLVFLPVLLLGLSACGGGGGGSSGFSSDSTRDGDIPSMASSTQNSVNPNVTSAETNTAASSTSSQNSSGSNPQQAFTFPSKAKVPAIRSLIWEAAKASPISRSRSVRTPRSSSTSYHSAVFSWTQTSEPATQDGDSVLFEWLSSYDSGELIPWVSFYTDGRSRGTQGQRERSVRNVLQTKIRNENGHAWADMAFYRKWTADDVDNLHFFDRYAARGPGEIWVYAYTDADGDGDGTPGEQSDEAADYLAGGVWVYAPETVVECNESNFICNEHEVGVFSYGIDPFETQSMWALEGTATYDGRAVGISTGTAGQTYFRASAEMTVSFGNSTDTGAIQGRIFDFVGENGSRMSGNPVVQLESRISFNNVEYVFGLTSHNDGTDSFAGEWAGHFYGNGHTSGIPTALGGTFGASTSDGSKVYLGAFSSRLDTYDATDFTLPQ